MLDPCCGSGHFLVAAFDLLARIRMHDDGLSARAACDAVLRDNLFGLELDARCTQIAAFNLALAAWKFLGAGGYRALPQMHIACSGQALRGRMQEWERLAGDDKRLRVSMRWMYDKFRQAPDLGSLIDPTDTEMGPAMGGTFEEVLPLLREALATEAVRNDAELTEQGVAAQGIARAAEILAGRYNLVTTNVPYLARGKQADPLKRFIDEHHSVAKADLATAFVHRMLKWMRPGGSLAIVTPQNWWFLSSYRNLRGQLLTRQTWNLVATLGEEAWQSFGDRGPVAVLMVLSRGEPPHAHAFAGLDALPAPTIAEKTEVLRHGKLVSLAQSAQYGNPDHRITIEQPMSGPLLRAYADSFQGVSPADFPRYGRCFWEVRLGKEWRFWQSTVEETKPFGGRELVLWWNKDLQAAVEAGIAYIRGERAWGKKGIACRQMRNLSCSIYTGEASDTNVAVIVPNNPAHLPAIWAYCSSPEFRKEVRKIDKKVNVTNATFVKVPFDLARWQAEADRLYPDGLPEPDSDDPTQWLFKGGVATADAPHNLQVAMARLLGYHWPDQAADKLDALAVPDGIICLPTLAGEPAAAERLRNLLTAAYGEEWSPAKQQALLAAVDFAGKTLEDWLRDGCFEQHCKLFGNRPFLWHVWDGRRDGFSAVVNYHQLDRMKLEKLAHHYLALWIKRQREAVARGESGADGRLAAAEGLQQKLKLILEGEPPYDIFVRWKPLARQPIGWEPDLNDGVRLNIRPFMTADVLRKRPNIKWSKDKGRDPETAPWYPVFQGDRINEHHLTLAEKKAARQAGGDA